MTNSNEKPSKPNFVPGSGRLTTDRFDFQHHVEGSDLRHGAAAISMDPVITFDGYAPTNVQDAITALANIVSPPTIRLADHTTPGIVQLSNLGDISGTALAMRVSKIQGIAVLSTPPQDGDVLVYTSLSGAWGPSGATFAFHAGQDLAGTNTFQSVIGISGQSGQANVHCQVVTWDAAVSNPLFTQLPNAAGAGTQFTIQAQNGTTTGGNVVLKGGLAPGNGPGGAILSLGDNTNMLQAGNTGNGRVVALFDQDSNLGTSLPSGTGDLVLYMANSASPPTSSAANGPLIYATNGQLWLRQSDGIQFQIGSIPNPSIWGVTGGPYNVGAPPSVGNTQEYTFRYSAQTTTGAPATVNFSIPNTTAVKVDVIIVGKQSGATTNSAQYNLSMGYVTDASGVMNAVGTLTSADPRTTAGASGWTAATLSAPSNNLIQVSTGYNASTTINWTIITQMVLSAG